MLGRQLEALAHHVQELSYAQIAWHQILLLVDVVQPCRSLALELGGIGGMILCWQEWHLLCALLTLLKNDGHAIREFLQDAVGPIGLGEES